MTRQNNNKAEQEIRSIIERWRQMGLSNDIQSWITDLEQNTDRNLISINADGTIGSFEKSLKAFREMKPGEYKIETMNIDDVQIRIHGDMAIASYILTATGQSNGKPFNTSSRESVVLVKRNGKWINVFEQRTPIQSSNQTTQ
ncbi:MAG: nuclear transport factor 2 family protein [Acidobacteriota bacterium]|nr:nuclear transport factor 2 family protein [Acidobacteriota bacterium]